MNEVLRPLDTLNGARNKSVLVELKNGRQYVGKLRSFDIHVNTVLEECEEKVDGELKRKIVIKAQSASKSAIEKIEKSGGEIFLSRKSAKKEKENPSTKKSEGKIALTKKRADDEKGKAVKVSKENVK